MNVTSSEEQSWRNFPELHRLFIEAPLPDKLYHHQGMSSPYTTVLDDIHALAKIAAIVGSATELINEACRRAPNEDPSAHASRLKRVLEDLEHLEGRFRGITERFVADRVGELCERKLALREALAHAREENQRYDK